MDNDANPPSTSGTTWTATQTYVMAAVCLLIGVLVGYLVRGSAKPAVRQRTASVEMQQPGYSRAIRHGTTAHAHPG